MRSEANWKTSSTLLGPEGDTTGVLFSTEGPGLPCSDPDTRSLPLDYGAMAHTCAARMLMQIHEKGHPTR